VKIIDIDLERRRISLSIKQAAEGGEVAAEYREFYGEHAYDEQGNYIGPEFSEEGTEAAPDAAPEASTEAGTEADPPEADPPEADDGGDGEAAPA